jgi:hypothetical protein
MVIQDDFNVEKEAICLELNVGIPHDFFARKFMNTTQTPVSEISPNDGV